jgi:hypothetical protein
VSGYLILLACRSAQRRRRCATAAGPSYALRG